MNSILAFTEIIFTLKGIINVIRHSPNYGELTEIYKSYFYAIIYIFHALCAYGLTIGVPYGTIFSYFKCEVRKTYQNHTDGVQGRPTTFVIEVQILDNHENSINQTMKPF